MDQIEEHHRSSSLTLTEIGSGLRIVPKVAGPVGPGGGINPVLPGGTPCLGPGPISGVGFDVGPTLFVARFGVAAGFGLEQRMNVA